MENATKALLIAAAVLIAIVLIALGVNLLNAGGDTSDKAAGVGESLKTETGKVSGTAVDKITDVLGGSTGDSEGTGGTTQTAKDKAEELAGDYQKTIQLTSGSSIDSIDDETGIRVSVVTKTGVLGNQEIGTIDVNNQYTIEEARKSLCKDAGLEETKAQISNVVYNSNTNKLIFSFLYVE